MLALLTLWEDGNISKLGVAWGTHRRKMRTIYIYKAAIWVWRQVLGTKQRTEAVESVQTFTMICWSVVMWWCTSKIRSGPRWDIFCLCCHIAQQTNFQTSRQDPLSISGAKIPPKHATSHHLQSNVMLTSSFGEEVMAVFSQFGSRSLKQRKNWGVAKTTVWTILLIWKLPKASCTLQTVCRAHGIKPFEQHHCFPMSSRTLHVQHNRNPEWLICKCDAKDYVASMLTVTI